MAVASNLLVITALVVVSFCASSQSNGEMSYTEDSQSQVLPRCYSIYTNSFPIQSLTANSCLNRSSFINCSKNHETLTLIDCNLGPMKLEDLHAVDDYVYRVLSSNGFQWVVFDFDETFVLKTVKIHYYCLLDVSLLEFTVQQYNGNNCTDLNSTLSNCQRSEMRKELKIEIQDDQHGNMMPESRVVIRIHHETAFRLLYLSEVQFFKDLPLPTPTPSQQSTTTKLISPSLPSIRIDLQQITSRSSPECCSSSSNLATGSHDDGPATVATTHPPTPDNTASGEQGAVPVKAFLGALVCVLFIIVVICLAIILYFHCKSRLDRGQEGNNVDELPDGAETTTPEVTPNSAYAVCKSQTAPVLTSSQQQQYKDVQDIFDYAAVNATLIQPSSTPTDEPTYEHLD